MRHLMWILTWIAVGIGGALGAASVIMLSASRSPSQTPEIIGGTSGQREPVLVTKPRSGGQGRSLIAGGRSRHSRPASNPDLLD